MENKYVGFMLLGVSAIVVVIIFLFQKALREVVVNSCGLHSSSCPMFVSIDQQTYLALAIVGLLVIISLVLIFTKPTERVIIKKIKEKKLRKKIDLKGFRSDEKAVFKLIQDSGTIFQADLIEKTGFGKGKMTRILDKLDGKGLVERKRRGLTNVVVLKEF